jgi:SAM-dependent methyltransferase
VPVKGSDDAEQARWFDINDLPNAMAFDHNLVAEKALRTLKDMQAKKIDEFLKIDSLNWAYRTSRVLQIASRVGIFNVLSEKPLSAEQVSLKCDTDAGLTERLLIACTALGLLIKAQNQYRNSDMADTYLVKGKKLYQGNMIAHSAWIRTKWDDIEKSICNKPTDPETEQHYNFIMAMDNIANASRADFFLNSIDLSGRKLLLDVGGGPGSYSIAACKKYPPLKAVVFDLKETIDIARKVIAREGMAKRIDTIESSWEAETFGSGFDVVMLSNIMHGKNSDAPMKLKKAYDALEPGGLLAVQEFLLDDNKDGPLTAALFNMMVGAFSQSELIEVISQAGFANAQIVSVKEYLGSGWVTALKPQV